MPVKYFVLFSIFFLSALPLFAEENYFSDVPEGHYAYDYIYDLVRRGVTSGYPDGTFRGKNGLSRYEYASFLSRLAKSLDKERGANEKIIEEIKSEKALLEEGRKETAENNFGRMDLRWRKGQAPAQSGARADYRLQYQWQKNFGKRAGLKINFDTMDAGFGGTTRNFTGELLDFVGTVNAGWYNLKTTFGPGDVPHPMSSAFPSEARLNYARQPRSITAASQFGKTGFGLEYLVLPGGSSGSIGTAELSARMSQQFAALTITINPQVYFIPGGSRNARLELSGELGGTQILVGVRKSNGSYLKGKLQFGDGFQLLAQSIDGNYREKTNYVIYDLFSRDVPDGSNSVGLELNRKFSPAWSCKVKGDYANPGKIITAEIKVGCQFTDKYLLGFTYQAYRDATISSIFALTGEMSL